MSSPAAGDTDMVDASTMVNVVQAVGILIGVVLAIIQLRNISRTRQAELFMQLYNNFHKPEFFNKLADFLTWEWMDYDDYMKKYGRETNPQAWYVEGSVAAFFEGIGVLVHRNLIDVGLVGELMSRHVKLFWEKIAPISKEMRRRLHLPQIDEPIEYLYNEMVKRGQIIPEFT